jgi:hypothetical protein
MKTIFYERFETPEGYAYEPVELVIGKGSKPYGCECYAYRTKDDVMHLIQCDQCGGDQR